MTWQLLLFFDSFIPYSITTMSTSLAKKAIDANRGKVAPFVTNQVSLYDHQPQKIDCKTYNFSSSQIPNLDRHVALMTIPLQVSVPASFFSSSSNYYLFKMLFLQELDPGDGPYQHLVHRCPAGPIAYPG